jgi:hypothetical protein
MISANSSIGWLLFSIDALLAFEATAGGHPPSD